jgi:hypothetical protein
MCKIFSKKKKTEPVSHTEHTCHCCKFLKAIQDGTGQVNPFPCDVGTVETSLMPMYWSLFGYHSFTLQDKSTCQCTRGVKDTRQSTVNYPMQCPFTLGEVSGKYLGWIDEKLATLILYTSSTLLYSNLQLEGSTDLLFKIWKYLMNLRAIYWYLVTNEKRRCMTEVLFAQRLHLTATTLNEEDSMMFLQADENKAASKNVWWETFLHQLADFYKRLRWTHYQMFDMAMPDHRRQEFGHLVPIQKYAIDCLRQPLEFLLPSKLEGPMMNSNFMVTLSEGTLCSACDLDLSNKTAAWQILSVIYTMWPVNCKEMSVRAIKGLPIIFEARNLPMQMDLAQGQELVSCGAQDCIQNIAKVWMDYFEQLAIMTINWVFKTHRCHGCLKFCYESHRCSGCRSVRYCSKACLLEDWKVHEPSCKEMAGDEEETASVRKLEGEKKEAFYHECIEYLCKVDLYFQMFANKWRESGRGMYEIIIPAGRKSKVRNEATGSEKSEKERKRRKDEQKQKEASRKEITPKANQPSVCCPSKEEDTVEKLCVALSKNGFDPNTVKVKGMTTLGESKPTTKVLQTRVDEMQKAFTDCALSNEAITCTSTCTIEIKKKGEKEKCVDKKGKEKKGKTTPKTPKDLNEEREQERDHERKTIKEMINQLPSGLRVKLAEGVGERLMEKDFNADVSAEEYKRGEKEFKRMVAHFGGNNPQEVQDEVGKEEGSSERTQREKKKDMERELGLKIFSVINNPEAEDNNFETESEMSPVNGPRTCNKRIIEIFRSEILGKHFEINHIKTHTWMNSRICKIEDVSIKKSIFNPRVICTIKGDKTEGKQYSLKVSNMVDIAADLNDLDLEHCRRETSFQLFKTVLLDSTVKKLLGDSTKWMMEQEWPKMHHAARYINCQSLITTDVKTADWTGSPSSGPKESR